MKNCLVVDDSRVIRTVARRILEDLGYSVEEAEDGMEGLDELFVQDLFIGCATA